MQDNARVPVGQVYVSFLYREDISVINLLAMSPDLNQIEHTWGILSRRIPQWPHYPENVQNRIDALVQNFHIITQHGIGSMPRRRQDCVDDRGGHTNYW